MRIEEKIIQEFEKTIVQMAGHQDGPDVTDEIKAYNEGIIDSFTKISTIVDNYEMNVEDGQTELTVGFLGGTEKHSFDTVNEAIETLSTDYSPDLVAVSVPALPISVIFEMEAAKNKELPIWKLFDKAKVSQDEEWAQWTLANSDLVAAAWTTDRYDII